LLYIHSSVYAIYLAFFIKKVWWQNLQQNTYQPRHPPSWQFYLALASLPSRETDSWTPALHTFHVHEHENSGRYERTGETKSNIVVAVRCIVPVAIRGTQVPRFIVPRATAQHARDLYWPIPLLNTVRQKIARRKPSVSA